MRLRPAYIGFGLLLVAPLLRYVAGIDLPFMRHESADEVLQRAMRDRDERLDHIENDYNRRLRAITEKYQRAREEFLESQDHAMLDDAVRTRDHQLDLLEDDYNRQLRTFLEDYQRNRELFLERKGLEQTEANIRHRPVHEARFGDTARRVAGTAKEMLYERPLEAAESVYRTGAAAGSRLLHAAEDTASEVEHAAVSPFKYFVQKAMGTAPTRKTYAGEMVDTAARTAKGAVKGAARAIGGFAPGEEELEGSAFGRMMDSWRGRQARPSTVADYGAEAARRAGRAIGVTKDTIAESGRTMMDRAEEALYDEGPDRRTAFQRKRDEYERASKPEYDASLTERAIEGAREAPGLLTRPFRWLFGGAAETIERGKHLAERYLEEPEPQTAWSRFIHGPRKTTVGRGSYYAQPEERGWFSWLFGTPSRAEHPSVAERVSEYLPGTRRYREEPGIVETAAEAARRVGDYVPGMRRTTEERSRGLLETVEDKASDAARRAAEALHLRRREERMPSGSAASRAWETIKDVGYNLTHPGQLVDLVKGKTAEERELDDMYNEWHRRVEQAHRAGEKAVHQTERDAGIEEFHTPFRRAYESVVGGPTAEQRYQRY